MHERSWRRASHSLRFVPMTLMPIPGTPSRPCSASRRHTRFRFHICTTKTNRWHGLMAPSAHPTSSAMTRTAGSNTVVALMRAAPLRRRPAHAGSWSRPCVQLRRPAVRRPGKFHRSAVPSSGSQGRETGRHANRSRAKSASHETMWLPTFGSVKVTMCTGRPYLPPHFLGYPLGWTPPVSLHLSDGS